LNWKLAGVGFINWKQGERLTPLAGCVTVGRHTNMAVSTKSSVSTDKSRPVTVAAVPGLFVAFNGWLEIRLCWEKQNPGRGSEQGCLKLRMIE